MYEGGPGHCRVNNQEGGGKKPSVNKDLVSKASSESVNAEMDSSDDEIDIDPAMVEWMAGRRPKPSTNDAE
eukprot:SAG31_NODE_16639_length_701_cov_1.926910_1_plen_71_part_00